MIKGNVVPFVKGGKRAVSVADRSDCGVLRRMLSATEAAAYLGYKSPSILKKAGVPPVRLQLVGGERGEPKYDRLDLDALIERSKGVAQSDVHSSGDSEDADAILMQWRLKRGA